jgi:hypothetical protein
MSKTNINIKKEINRIRGKIYTLKLKKEKAEHAYVHAEKTLSELKVELRLKQHYIEKSKTITKPKRKSKNTRKLPSFNKPQNMPNQTQKNNFLPAFKQNKSNFNLPVTESPVVESPPVESFTSEPIPVESPPVESPPVESPPIESFTAEPEPVESPPIESPPIESPPIESPPIESQPVESPPVEEPPSEDESESFEPLPVNQGLTPENQSSMNKSQANQTSMNQSQANQTSMNQSQANQTSMNQSRTNQSRITEL